ncbi:MAG TPA: ATP-binding protein [Terracidiphilus sp.]|nr:ATP-binding protein [Terracidiphilus sp.]
MQPTGTLKATARKRTGQNLTRTDSSLDRGRPAMDRRADGFKPAENNIGRRHRRPEIELAAGRETHPETKSITELSNPGSLESRRVETVVETLADLRSQGETLAAVAHDARNMVTALGLYCDLLEEPGVLATPFIHYSHELRLVAAASRRMVEKIVAIEAQRDAAGAETGSATIFLRGRQGNSITAVADEDADCAALSEHSMPATTSVPNREPDHSASTLSSASRRWDLLPAMPVSNMAAELLANRNLLAALAGPSIALTVDADGGASPVRLTGEDLTRILVNLVKNAAEAMPDGGRIHIGLGEQLPAKGTAACLRLTVEDNGPGIAAEDLETIFESGFTSHGVSERANGNWALNHRGLGLTITRSIVEGAGGRIIATNRKQGGACFVLELPVRKAS